MQEMKDWTIMFYFASDNPLAPGIIAQMKSIKYAGFHPQANVIAQFDPNTVGAPTHIFDVNHIAKLKKPNVAKIGFEANDPFVRNMIEDKLWRDQKSRDDIPIRDKIKKNLPKYDPPIPPSDRDPKTAAAAGVPPEPSPRDSLDSFLNFCCDNYPARNYILFILGHGLVVGNDIFLLDEHAKEKSLSLKGLGEVLVSFKEQIRRYGAQFQLVGFHSCSVSSIEVAYELQGTANYMLASQSPAFVGSWPYRQILIRMFNDLVTEGADIDVKKMLVRIFYYCLYNSLDFLLAGYSFDLCLCDLNRVSDLNGSLQELSRALTAGLADQLAKDVILLSHWKSQSYWQETYTDLYDFCLCLSKRCESASNPEGGMPETLQAIYTACGNVMQQLAQGVEGDDDKLIVRAEFAGPAYQYSHGFSIFFPWSEPSEDSNIMTQYQGYKFTGALQPSWHSFLKEYFKETMRESRKSETPPARMLTGREKEEAELNEDMASLIYNGEGTLSGTSALKVTPIEGTGGECNCGSIKNYPHDTRPRREKADNKAFPLGEDFFEQLDK
jgi:hypothetical protein